MRGWREFRRMYSSEWGEFNVDDMNKVMVGSSEDLPAVSRRHHLCRYYPTDLVPNTRTHDFPKCQKIDASGYMLLK